MKKVIIIFCLLIIIFLAAYFRIILPDKWLHGETLRLPTVDAYYQARFAQIINAHGNDLPPNDPYFTIVSSNSTEKSTAPTFWGFVISFLAKIISPLNPNASIDIVCYYLPPVLGILCVIVVFFISTLLFNAWSGLFAAFLLATLGGEFMARSIAGSADYHAWEVFLLVGFMLCVISSVKWHNIRNGIPSLLMAILAGLFIAVYIKSWYGAFYLYMIILATYILYLILLSIKLESASGIIFGILCTIISSSVLFYIILTQLTGALIDNNTLIVSAICLIVIIIATVMHALAISRNNKWAFIVGVFILGVCGIIVLLKVFQNTYFSYIINIIQPLFLWGTSSHTSEERPILLFGNEFSLQVIWGNFTAALFLCIIGIGMLIKRLSNVDRHILFNLLFILVGTVVMLLATLGMVRFAYYFAVFVACMAGLLIFTIINVGIGYLRRNVRKMKWYDKIGDVLLILAILSLILIPNIMISRQFSNPLEGSLTGGWEQASLWLKNNTAEPFGDSEYYYANYNKDKRTPSYSVMSWWDYGYWIMYVGHRVPVCNPGSNGRIEAAMFMTTTNNDGALRVLDKMKSQYVVIDYQMTTGKFTAMPSYAYAEYYQGTSSGVHTKERASAGLGEIPPEYMGIYNIGDGKGSVSRVNIFYPEYYQSMAVRLFNFDCQPVKSPGCPILIYTEKDGSKWIQKVVDSPSYNEAIKYSEANKLVDGEKYAFGGTDPFLPCVDLPEVRGIVPLKGFGGVDLSGMSQAVKQTYEVKVFQYIKSN